MSFDNFKLAVSDDTFEPTTISKVASKLDLDVEGKSLLDLGCGVGPIAIHFARCGAMVTASDVNEKHVAYTEMNAHNNIVDIDVIQSDLFESVLDTYDIIFCDVSGIPKFVADATNWYPSGVPVADDTGNNLVHKVIEQAPEHLNKGGELYICSSSLSNQFRTIRKIRDHFSEGEVFYKKAIPFCPELYPLVEEGKLDQTNYDKKGSRYVWYLYVYRAVK